MSKQARIAVRPGALRQAAAAVVLQGEDWPPLESERERIRCWLHDTVLQSLEYMATRGYSDPALDLGAIADIAGRAADELRDALPSLGADSQPCDLLEGIRHVVDEANAPGDLCVTLLVGRIECSVSGSPAQAVVDAVRESLTNVRKHSGIDHAEVFVQVDGREAFVSVVDHGKGFIPETARPGMGIRQSIEGRVSREGGEVAIESLPGKGTTIKLRLRTTGNPAHVTAAGIEPARSIT